nr:FAR1 DNA binding domain-containing protein [Tanacetum cinerariifolium]
MMTSSTSSLLSANSSTTNLPMAMTTNLPPATSTTTNLPSETSTTSHLLLATSATSHLPPVTSSTSHLLSSISMTRACNINEADLFVVSVVVEEILLIEAKIKEVDDVTMNEDVEANEIYEGCWACQIQEFKKEEGCEIVKVRDIRAGAYRTLYKEEGKEILIQEKDKVVDYKFVEKLENIKKEIQVKVPNPPSQKTGDVIEDIYAIKKPKKNLVNNPQKASNKGGRRGKQKKVEGK